MKKYTIYKKNVMDVLAKLADYEFQRVAWFANNQGLSYSFNENVNDLFEDFHLEQALYDNVVVFSAAADQALRDLNDAVETIDGDSYPETVLLNSSEMQTIREKAARALALIHASDGSESTVEILP